MLLERAGLDERFDALVCGDEAASGKPAPDIFLKAASLIGCDPGTCMVLEDSPGGILAAARAGMIPVMVPDLVQPSPETRSLCHKIFSSLSEVRNFLASII
jgi:beta-phosphoglucomutase-like phosphatase (HAD superfamily)